MFLLLYSFFYVKKLVEWIYKRIAKSVFVFYCLLFINNLRKIDLKNKIMKMDLQNTITFYFHFSFVFSLLFLCVFLFIVKIDLKWNNKMFFISFSGKKINKYFFFLFAKQEKKGNETTIQNSHKDDLFHKFQAWKSFRPKRVMWEKKKAWTIGFPSLIRTTYNSNFHQQ